MNFNNIPEELKGLKQWVVWRYDTKNGLPVKIPYSPVDLKAQGWNSPKKWGSYEQALMLFDERGFDGIGFCFKEGGGIVGIDLDDCFNTAGGFNSYAQDIMNMIGETYWEFSPRGKGVHGIAFAYIDVHSNKKSLEMYSKNKFFTMTGEVLPNATGVKDCSVGVKKVFDKFIKIEKQALSQIVASQGEQYKLSNDEIISKALSSKSEFKFKALMDGEWQDIYKSQSEADQALCNYLAFWTGRNTAQMDEIFRLSGLIRKKWDEIHTATGLTYGNMTINKAIKDCKEVYYIYEMDKFHRCNDKGQPTGTRDKAIVEYILERNSILIIEGLPYLYENGVYLEDIDGNRIKDKIQAVIYDFLVTSILFNRIYKLLLMQTKIQVSFEELNAYPKHWINFRNCMFDVRTGEVIKHDPKYLSINQIPPDWKGSLQKPRTGYFDKFIDFAICEEDKEMLLEYFGYLMTIDNSQQKMLLLNSDSGTGKSVIISVAANIVGNKNFSAIPLQKLNERFYSTGLRGKLLNICADITSGAMKDTSVIKQITGEDTTLYERKGVDVSFFHSYAKMLFSANRLPKNSDEQSGAYYRRLLIVEMNNKPQNAIPNLFGLLLDEIDYIICLAVSHLKKMYDRGSIFESQNSKALAHELHRYTDSVTAFLEDCTAKHQHGRVKRDDAYSCYERYCFEEDLNPIMRKSFYLSLKDKGYTEKKINGNRYIGGLELLKNRQT